MAIMVSNIWNIDKIKEYLKSAFNKNSEQLLLRILKENSFLFYELFLRKYGIQPIFHEVSFGTKHRCDFVWLNNNSDGPEWTLVEIEEPNLELFKKNGEPGYKLNHAIGQVKSWRRYFTENPSEKKRIFKCVVRFRYILVAGNKESWTENAAAKWRIDHNNESNIEIRSSDIFWRALKILKINPNELWNFAEYPVTRDPSELTTYYEDNNYMCDWYNRLH